MNILTGEQHSKVHRWWMAAFAPRVLATWREEVIRPVVEAQLDRHVKDGKADLGRLANGIHIRMIAGTVGMPWDDDEWMNRWEDVTTRNQRLKWHMADNDVPQEIIDDALAASEEMRAELLKWVRMHSGGEGDYLISMMWRDFPALFDDFDEEDVLANLKPAFETNSTRAAIRNALYALATHPRSTRTCFPASSRSGGSSRRRSGSTRASARPGSRSTTWSSAVSRSARAR